MTFLSARLFAGRQSVVVRGLSKRGCEAEGVETGTVLNRREAQGGSALRTVYLDPLPTTVGPRNDLRSCNSRRDLLGSKQTPRRARALRAFSIRKDKHNLVENIKKCFLLMSSNTGF